MSSVDAETRSHTLRELAFLALNRKRYREAERHLVQAVDLTEGRMGPRSIPFAEMVSLLGAVEMRRRRLRRAKVHQLHALALQVASGNRVVEVSAALTHLAMTLGKSGRISDGARLYYRALQLATTSLGDDHSHIGELRALAQEIWRSLHPVENVRQGLASAAIIQRVYEGDPDAARATQRVRVSRWNLRGVRLAPYLCAAMLAAMVAAWAAIRQLSASLPDHVVTAINSVMYPATAAAIFALLVSLSWLMIGRRVRRRLPPLPEEPISLAELRVLIRAELDREFGRGGRRRQVLVRHARAHCNALLGDPAAALADFDWLIDELPRNARIWGGRGVTRCDAGDLEAGLADLEHAVTLTDSSAYLWASLGDAYRRNGRAEDAVASADRALQLDAHQLTALRVRGIASLALERWGAAVDDLNEAWRLGPRDAVLCYHRGEGLRHRGLYEEALADFDQALQFLPNAWDALEGRGRCLRELGRHDEAEADLARSAQLNPASGQATGQPAAEASPPRKTTRSMLERYDAAALLMLRTAKLKAQTLGHPCIGTADLLLGLIDNPNSEGTRALRALDISIESLRRELEDAADREESGPDAYLHFSPRGKRVLEAASRESLRRGEDHIGTEHVLIGLVGEEAGAAGRVLARLSVDPTRIEGALSRPETR